MPSQTSTDDEDSFSDVSSTVESLISRYKYQERESLFLNEDTAAEGRPFSIYINESRLSSILQANNALKKVESVLSPKNSENTNLSGQPKMMGRRTSHYRYEGRNSPDKQRGSRYSTRRSSSGTVSTSLLLNSGNENSNSSGTPNTSSANTSSAVTAKSSLPERRTSSFYPQPDSRQLRISNHSLQAVADTSYQYDESLEPDIEEAVQLLKSEMGGIKASNLVLDEREDGDFIPNEYRMSKKTQSMSLGKTTRIPTSPSLLSSILQPPEAKDKENEEVATAIPVLRRISGPSKWNTTPPNKPSAQLPQETRQQQQPRDIDFTNKKPIQPLPKVTPPTIRKEDPFTDSQIELTINTIHKYRDKMTDLEKPTGLETKIPMQHVDSSSLSSDIDQESVYSTRRMTVFFICCMLIPPLFFMVGTGPRGGISDYRLMRMVMNSNHQLGLFKGFVWDVDVGWLRKTCLVGGILETLIIFACVAIGFGVGITRE